MEGPEEALKKMYSLVEAAPLHMSHAEPSPFVASWGTSSTRTTDWTQLFEYAVILETKGTLGFRVIHDGHNKWRVSEMDPNSQACLSGVQIDDQLVAINGSFLHGSIDQLKELTQIRPLTLIFRRMPRAEVQSFQRMESGVPTEVVDHFTENQKSNRSATNSFARDDKICDFVISTSFIGGGGGGHIWQDKNKTESRQVQQARNASLLSRRSKSDVSPPTPPPSGPSSFSSHQVKSPGHSISFKSIIEESCAGDATRVSSDNVPKLSRAIATLLTHWRYNAQPNFLPSVCNQEPDAFVAHNLLSPKEATLIQKLFQDIKPQSILRKGHNRASDCLLKIISRRANRHIIGTGILSQFLQRVDMNETNFHAIEVNQVAFQDVVVRLDTGNLLLSDTSVIFSIDRIATQQHFPVPLSAPDVWSAHEPKLGVVATFFFPSHAHRVATVFS